MELQDRKAAKKRKRYLTNANDDRAKLVHQRYSVPLRLEGFQHLLTQEDVDFDIDANKRKQC